ncbi:MAG: beta-N-acetylhexosaminidase [Fimbriimonas sp.]|nr:beta-N-acetylhexosaminidase [Fimbriimonas sp.]
MTFLIAALTLGGMQVTKRMTLPIIPEPVSIRYEDGHFTLGPKTTISAPSELASLAEMLKEDIGPAFGFDLPIVNHGDSDSIHLTLDKKLARLGVEGYTLRVHAHRIEISAPETAGVFYGIQTLRQLLPTESFRKDKTENVAWTVPCARIEDYPRFGWRGMHIDASRHFMPKEFILKYIDLIALHKMNVLHFHLTDDQGWRIEIKKYPKLTSVGGWRKESMAGHYGEHRFDGVPHGGFYTQEDIKEIVRYAHDRFVKVVPEIEMPGHAQAAIAAYPELGNTGKPLDVFTEWGVDENVFNVDDSTIHFLQDVLTEVVGLFPSEFIHVGGDECPKTQWKASPEAQARIKALGLKDENELQSWFIHQMDTFLASKGRRLVGWDEILEGGLAPGATVMSWQGEEGGVAAAKAGHDVVMTPAQYTYFDHYQTQDHKAEGLTIGGYLPLRRVYGYEPVPKELNAEEAKHVLGAQGQLWTEYIPNPKRLEFMGFPRTCALSEVLWTPKKERDYDQFLSRLSVHLERLTALDVNYCPLGLPK